MARLSEFLRYDTEQILAEWETFARSLPGGDRMPVESLRDHAKDMLGVIARDLDRGQTERQRTEKAKGRSDADEDTVPTAAQEHGAGRAESGFTVEQMVSEFRALRASVLRLWAARQTNAESGALEDITRFNEAIDQAIAESLAKYTQEIGQSKDRFIAILGHDLRTPIGAIMMSSQFVLEIGGLPEQSRGLVTQMERSARRMNQLVADLLEFTRTRFGDEIPVERAATEMSGILRNVVSEVAASYPESAVEVETTGDLAGHWDADRIHQALTNLVSNAVQHGNTARPIHVSAKGADAEVEISIHNDGAPIPSQELQRIFEGGRDAGGASGGDRRHLGLGLYIVHRIIKAHGGSVGVESTADAGTTFTVRLPRHA